jgi:hypothetical protein
MSENDLPYLSTKAGRVGRNETQEVGSRVRSDHTFSVVGSKTKKQTNNASHKEVEVGPAFMDSTRRTLFFRCQQ